jgi:hypothetical protein
VEQKQIALIKRHIKALQPGDRRPWFLVIENREISFYVTRTGGEGDQVRYELLANINKIYRVRGLDLLDIKRARICVGLVGLVGDKLAFVLTKKKGLGQADLKEALRDTGVKSALSGIKALVIKEFPAEGVELTGATDPDVVPNETERRGKLDKLAAQLRSVLEGKSPTVRDMEVFNDDKLEGIERRLSRWLNVAPGDGSLEGVGNRKKLEQFMDAVMSVVAARSADQDSGEDSEPDAELEEAIHDRDEILQIEPEIQASLTQLESDDSQLSLDDLKALRRKIKTYEGDGGGQDFSAGVALITKHIKLRNGAAVIQEKISEFSGMRQDIIRRFEAIDGIDEASLQSQQDIIAEVQGYIKELKKLRGQYTRVLGP